MTAKQATTVAAAGAERAAAIAKAFDAPLDDRAREALAAWLARLVEWNARTDLTAARGDEELADLMLADAFALGSRLPAHASLVDVGSGAGAPGLPLAVLRPDVRVTLVEPRSKRASFLRTVVGEIDRTDICIERKRGEALGLGAWDVAIARATLPPPAWLDLGARLVRPGGTVWILLAQEPAPSSPSAVIEADLAYTWPLTGARRRAVAYRVRG